MKVPNCLLDARGVMVSLSRLRNEGSQQEMGNTLPGAKSIKATE